MISLLGELRPLFETAPVLLPCTDRSVVAISKYRSELEGSYRFQLPGHRELTNLIDKVGFQRFAEAEAFPVPRSREVQSHSDLELAIRDFSFPCYLKPFLKTEEWEANTQSKVYRVSEVEELRLLYDRVHPWSPEGLVVQEAIEGSDDAHFTCNCYFDDESRPLVSFVSQKLRQWPIGIGVASLSLSKYNSEVEELTLEVFRRARFRGLGYLEVKFDRRDRKPYIIEPNVGRPTGRSALAEASGIELLYTMYCDLAGLPVPPPPDRQDEKVKWLYLRQDLRSAWAYWRRGELSVRNWLHSIRGRKIFPVLSLSDPVPFVSDLFRCAFRGLVRLVRSERSRTAGAMASSPVRK